MTWHSLNDKMEDMFRQIELVPGLHADIVSHSD